MLITRISTLLLLLASFQAVLAQEPALPGSSTEPTIDSFADAGALGKYLESRIGVYFSAIEAIAADKKLIKAVTANNNKELQSLAQELQTKLPDSLKVRLYPGGTEKVDYVNSPACGYTCINLVRSAYQAPPRAEALLYKTSEANLTLVRAVYDRNQAIGAIVVHYPYSIIQQAVNKLSENTGLYTEFRQSHSGKINVLIPRGDSTIKQGPTQQSVRIAETRWSIGIWTPGGVAIEEYELPMLPWIPIAMGLLVLLTGIALVVGRIKHRRSKLPPPPASGVADFLNAKSPIAEHEGDETSQRTVVLGGGAADVDVSKYLKEEDITDLKKRLDD